jgi:hemerythrin-like domain-containing protein
MIPTEILEQEHGVIEIVLSSLEKMAEMALKSGAIDIDSATDAIDFIRNFADRCHHAKEEVHLFTMMEEKGFSKELGPIAVMLHDHNVGRAYVRAMEESVHAVSSGDEAAIHRFAENAMGYTGLLRSHIMKENRILYPMANQAFSDDDQLRLMEAFERVEKEEIGEGVHEKYHAIAQNLAEKYGVTSYSADPGCELGCCSGQ